MHTLETYGPALGRILLGVLFLVTGLDKVLDFDAARDFMMANGMTAATEFFLAAAIVVELAGALALIVGFRTRYAALLLALYLVPVTLVFHDFWMFTGMDRKAQLINFAKNVAIGGGLLYVAATGARALSLDQRRERARPLREVRA